MAGDRVAAARFVLVQGAFKLVVGERVNSAAVFANEVVVVLASLVDRLEAGALGAEVDTLDVSVTAELFERSVDACDADATTLRAELVENRLGADAAALAPEELDDRSARASVSAPGSA